MSGRGTDGFMYSFVNTRPPQSTCCKDPGVVYDETERRIQETPELHPGADLAGSLDVILGTYVERYLPYAKKVQAQHGERCLSEQELSAARAGFEPRPLNLIVCTCGEMDDEERTRFIIEKYIGILDTKFAPYSQVGIQSLQVGDSARGAAVKTARESKY